MKPWLWYWAHAEDAPHYIYDVTLCFHRNNQHIYDRLGLMAMDDFGELTPVRL